MLEDFFKISANLKTIPRQGWIDKSGISSPESVADHVFSTSMMAMVLGDLLNLDTSKLVKMSLLHDLTESITGDLTPEQISKPEKKILENKTMDEILLHLPEQLQKNYSEIWHEFIENSSLESKLLHEIDKLEMALQATIYSKSFTKKSFDEFLETAQTVIVNPELKKIFNSLIDDDYKKQK